MACCMRIYQLVNLDRSTRRILFPVIGTQIPLDIFACVQQRDKVHLFFQARASAGNYSAIAFT